MNRILVSLLALALLGWCYAAPLESEESDARDEKNPSETFALEHEDEGVKHSHEDDPNDHDDAIASLEEEPGKVDASSSRVERDLPRPGRPSEIDDESNSDTTESPRPKQTGDQGEEDDSDQTGTKDVTRPRPPSGVQTLPAKIPEGFRAIEKEGPASVGSSRVERELPRPGQPGQDDDESDSSTREQPRPSQAGGEDQDEEDDTNTKDRPRPGPSSGIQTLPAKIPEGSRPDQKEDDEGESEE